MIHGTFCDKPFCCIARKAASIKRGARAASGASAAGGAADSHDEGGGDDRGPDHAAHHFRPPQ